MHILTNTYSRRRSRCKDCGGSGLCKHKRRKVGHPTTQPQNPISGSSSAKIHLYTRNRMWLCLILNMISLT